MARRAARVGGGGRLGARGWHPFEDATAAFLAHVGAVSGGGSGVHWQPGDRPWIPPNVHPAIPPPSPVPVRPAVRDSLAARAVERRHNGSGCVCWLLPCVRTSARVTP
jgi:hypothetical protein